MTNPGVYIETSIVSYLTANPSRDPLTLGNQQVTARWWQKRRADFDLYASPIVLREAGGGNPAMARKRLAVLATLTPLAVTQAAIDLADTMVARGLLPKKAEVDALHIAIAAVQGLDYLLTWNCKHIANAEIRVKVERFCRAEGYEPPAICTPQELLGA